ncbi:MAG: hypothetical protein VX777_07010 [Chlamydiota bacterium]|nr:hypothetical protein [Chlamydiota bacterium]
MTNLLLIKGSKDDQCNDLCIVGSGAIKCDAGESSWLPLLENIKKLALLLDFNPPDNAENTLYAEFLCSWIGEYSRVVTLRLAYHLIVALLNHRKKSEGKELRNCINRELKDLNPPYDNSYFEADWYDPKKLGETFEDFNKLYKQWQLLKDARSELAKVYKEAEKRLGKRNYNEEVEEVLSKNWILTLNWDTTLWDIRTEKIIQWHGLCSHSETMILPTEVYNSLEFIRVLIIPDTSWMCEKQKEFYDWCLKRTEALHAVTCKAHELISRASSIWFVGCALNTYDCEVNTAFSKVKTPNLKQVNIVNLKKNKEAVTLRTKFLISRKNDVEQRFIDV